MIELVESFTTTGVFVAVIYHSGKHEWLPVDKHLYLQDLKGVLNPECYDFPCYVEMELDNLYIHPRRENK